MDFSIDFSVEKSYSSSIRNDHFNLEHLIMKKFVTLKRVSTREQGNSGLGLEAQERDIQLFLENYAESPYEVVKEFVEIQSGKDTDRQVLKDAISFAKKHKCCLLVAKLDRLSRKLSVIASLMEDKDLEFKVAQMPFADKFQLHIYGALAEQERDFISIRTRSALQAYKQRNPHKKLGSPSYQVEKLNEGKKKKALEEAKKVSGLILPLRKQGASLRNICNTLNKSGITTCRGNEFHPSLVSRMLTSLECA